MGHSKSSGASEMLLTVTFSWELGVHEMQMEFTSGLLSQATPSYTGMPPKSEHLITKTLLTLSVSDRESSAL